MIHTLAGLDLILVVFEFYQQYFQKHAGSTAEVFEWPSQSPELNLIANLWREVKISVMARWPSYLKFINY